MFAIFCLRLATGLIGSLLLFDPKLVNPRFYRTHFLTALALTAGAIYLGQEIGGSWRWGACAVLALSFLGSLVWSLDRAPAGRILIGLTALALAAILSVVGVEWCTDMDALRSLTLPARQGWLAIVADELTSAAVLGTATTAMLMGHSYLIAPSMSLTPLLRLLAGLFVAVGFRVLLSSAGFYLWARNNADWTSDSETLLWLPLRWGVGFVAPLVFAWMAREATKIRSTQSATGILYVVVIFCFLGELTSQLLYSNTGRIL